MKCPKCGFDQAEGFAECLHCGIVFEKYLKRLSGDAGNTAVTEPEGGTGQMRSPILLSGQTFFPDSALQDEDAGNPFYFGGRVMVFLGILILGLKLMFSSLDDLSESGMFLHLVNLPFHEAGHIFFRVLGRFMTSLGGTLGQLLMPVICMVTFLVKTRDSFGAAVCLWWLGENFMDIAPYINDANLLVLPLLGGNTGSTAPYGFHDWEYILTESGLVEHSHAIALSSLVVGDIVMAAALFWAGYVLFGPYLCRKKH